MTMKKIIYSVALGAILLTTSCGRDFLNIDQIDRLTGNNYWQSSADVEQYLGGIYATFRSATMGHIFFPATGDFRAGSFERGPSALGSNRDYLSMLRANNLNAIYARHTDPNRAGANESQDYFGFHQIRRWDVFFRMVSNANILYEQVGRMAGNEISVEEAAMYQAEAVFLRNLAYFFMVRIFGDVPYYTEGYNAVALPRTNMLTVLRACSDDLQAHYKDLPWTYDDQSVIAVKAMRGSAIVLMMHINMWVAGFTQGDKSPYYELVAELGREITQENQNAYELLPLSRTRELFKGRTKEGLFEIVQNFNFGETFHLSATYADYVLRFPNKVTPTSYIYYQPRFMEKMYPPADADLRKTWWFDEHIYATSTGMFQCLKFLNVFMEEGEDNNPDDNQIVFRYVDAFLLRAEALAELGRDEEARNAINVVRGRAGAAPFNTSGDDLKEEIWWERVRELIGEGHLFYDLVRTRKVLNSEYTSFPIPIDAFNRGAWTWPIDVSAFNQNPYMTPNNYWN